MTIRYLVAAFVLAVAWADTDFNRDIRPILSENCFHCHGPDAKQRKAKLRLDTRAGATAVHDGSAAIVPGQPDQSELWHRVTSNDPDERMPPPDSKRDLSPAQIQTLQQWIESSADYTEHWAWTAPARAPAPKGPAAVDHFIDAALKQRGLTPAPAADRRTLLRRLSLDLVGLPPTPEDVELFLADKRPDAVERQVDRLLASPRFGERWARPWLDLARYADSNGFQADQLRDSWAYRDWVIDALNDNMPFDRFTVEQLAGDLLPEATPTQHIATGFHRTVPCNVEAGVHPEENRVNQVMDRVNVTGTVWLGLTMECAQCHDHKYDPFTMRDYYQLFAYFNNTPLEVRNPKGSGVSFDFYGPKMSLPPSGEQAQRQGQLASQREALDAERDRLLSRPVSDLEDWVEDRRIDLGRKVAWHPLRPTVFASTGDEDHEILDDGSVLVTGNLPGTTRYTLEFDTKLTDVTAIRLEALTHDRLPGKGPGRGDAKRTNFVLNEFSARAGDRPLTFARGEADFSQKSWPVGNAIDGKRDTGWAIAPQFGEPHWAVFHLAKPTELAGALSVELDQNYGRGRTLGRVRISVRTGGTTTGIPEELAAILRKPNNRWSEEEQKDVLRARRADHPRFAAIEKRLAAIDKELGAMRTGTTLVMVEMDEARPTHILKRGNYLDPQERVQPGPPAALHAPDPNLPANRLGLARWLVDRDNPLVARVTVNRWWAELFGRGIVATLEDFGTQSEPPTHPELLDWLAVEFMDSGWDMKHILRTIVLSATYQRDSRVRPRDLDTDPANHFLARGARFRLDAETIRDNALAASGLLSDRMRGQPIMPYQPPNIWRTVGRNAPKWVEMTDENRWRRGVYLVYRRAAPYPSLVNFDAPDRAACTVKRPRTNTPLQALTLLNDPAYVEMAVALADRMISEGGPGAADRIQRGFQRVLARPANDREVAILRPLVEKRGATELVKRAARVYQPTTKDHDELAAWFFVANAILNLDETITRE